MTSNFNYYLNIPDGPNNPSNDWPLMQTNTNSTAGIIGVDHIGFGQNNGGYHTIIHMPPQTSPSVLSGIGQFYSKTTTIGAVTDQNLFYTSGQGFVFQLTGNVRGDNGYQYLGGTIIQWGKISGLSGSWPSGIQTVTYSGNNLTFSVDTFNVNVTFIGPTSSSTGDICIISKSTTGFQWEFTGSSSSSFDGFYWFAIGA